LKIKHVVAGIGAVCLVGLLGACSANSSSSSTTTAASTVTASSSASMSPMQTGDCLDMANVSQGSGGGNIPTIDCSQAHDSEVVYVYDLTDTTFDATTIQNEAQNQCDQATAAYVGPNYQSVAPSLQVEFLSPTVDTWNSGNREVDCLVTTQDGTPSLTSSVQGMGDTQPSGGTSADRTDASADQTDASATPTSN